MARKKAGGLPTNIGEAVDLAYKRRAERLEAERVIKDMKREEAALEAHIIELLKAQGLKKGTGRLATGSITTLTVPRVTDWDSFYGYIHKQKAYDLLERRPSRTAYRDRLEAGVAVPGVTPEDVQDLSLTKAGEE